MDAFPWLHIKTDSNKVHLSFTDHFSVTNIQLQDFTIVARLLVFVSQVSLERLQRFEVFYLFWINMKLDG